MITATAKVENPNSMQVSVTLTMSLPDWEKLTEALAAQHGYPFWQVTAAINRAVDKIRAVARETLEGLVS